MAFEYFKDKKYSKAIELCQMRLKENPEILSGRIIYARALFQSGQNEAAETQFYKILQEDPNNLMALKFIGDLKFRNHDEETAFSYYSRIFQINPYGFGISCLIEDKPVEETRILSLQGKKEPSASVGDNLRRIPFRTETLADLLMLQGHARMALDMYMELLELNNNLRIKEKLERAQELLKYKEKKNV